MSNDGHREVAPVTLPLRYLHAFLAGRVSFLHFCQEFEWVEEESDAQGVNPFFRYERDNMQIASIEITGGGGNNPLVTFCFEPDSRE